MGWGEKAAIYLIMALAKAFIKKIDDDDTRRELNHGLVVVENTIREENSSYRRV